MSFQGGVWTDVTCTLCGHAGVGSIEHLAGELFKSIAGTAEIAPVAAISQMISEKTGDDVSKWPPSTSSLGKRAVDLMELLEDPTLLVEYRRLTSAPVDKQSKKSKVSRSRETDNAPAYFGRLAAGRRVKVWARFSRSAR